MIGHRVLPLLLAHVVALSGVLASAVEPTAEPAAQSSQAIEKWIAQLGSELYQEREEATRKLLALEEAVPALRRALKSRDAEVSRRAALILGVLSQSVAEKAVKDLLAEVKRGQIEQLIGQLVKDRSPAAEKRWESVFRMAQGLTVKASHIHGKDFQTPGLELARIPVMRECPGGDCLDRRILLGGTEQDLSYLRRCVLLSEGSLKHISRIDGSILLVNGSIKSCTRMRNSIVFCRGDLGEVTSIDGCIIVVLGRLEKVVYAEDSLFQVKDAGHFTASRNNVYLNAQTVAATFPEADRFLPPGQAGVPAPLPAVIQGN